MIHHVVHVVSRVITTIMALTKTLLLLSLLCFFENSLQNAQEKFKVKAKMVEQTVGSPWPMPQEYSTEGTAYAINAAGFSFRTSNEEYTCTILEEAYLRYFDLTFGRRPETLYFKPMSNAVGLSELVVDLRKPCSNSEYPKLESDESYKLSVNNGQALISATEVWGALRGLETFSQIVYQGSLGEFLVNRTMISDFPRFPHRGMLLDTSRHFISVSILKQNLDALAQNKYNVFHWHIVDDPSFPYQSTKFPQITKMGAFDPETHVYTQSDVQDIIEYARLRGIRVVPEFDSPGHTQSWGNGQTDLLTKCYSGQQATGTFGPINPVPNTTYTFLKSFFTEVSQVFPDQYIHLGGDEVDFTCWESNPEVKAFVAKMNYTSYSQLEQYYMQNLLDIVGGLGKGYQIWQEVIDNGAKVRPDTVVEVWKDGWEAEMDKVTKLGYKTLLSTCWYLNYISYGSDWTKYYTCEPFNFPGTDTQKKLIQGGETCMWGEFVDGTNLISRVWPRSAAVGERLWSAQNVNNVNTATPRLAEHRCRMLRRGFQAEPITGPGFCKTEFS